ncbi:hypothetical protein FRB95_010888 [Tulasnella sp. JGI-2019a]|nr:hypothetical protein FRB95_010888 [Tulasnella sp. JGI-2019a]
MGQGQSSNQSNNSSPAQVQQRRPPPPRRTSSTHLRAAKRSLEFPEFSALLTSPSSNRLPPPSSAIPIPMATTAYQQPPSPPHRRAHYFPPSSAMLHGGPPPNAVRHPSGPSTQPPQQQQPQASSSSHSQQPTSKSQVVAKPSVTVVPRDQNASPVVRSRLPTGLPEPSVPIFSEDDPEGTTQEATVTWRGVAKDVYLTGVADRAHERVRMTHEPGSKSTFFTTLRLPPGNHPLRFIVDEQPRCTDTLPTATDTDGTLINYIEIASPTASPDQMGASTNGEGGRTFEDMNWTEDIPPRLFKLAAAEEAYLAARAAAANPTQPPSTSGRHPAPPYSALPPPPAVPYPPSLPRHLEKVILNNSSSRGHGPNAASFTPAILSSSSSARPRIIGTGTTGPLIPPLLPQRHAGGAGVGVPSLPSATLPGTNLVLPAESLGDDNSVLPVPNHVVLNHLGTSAIKNAVLAVGTTTRYHRKYISTIYYKPI